ncbi:MAG: hypothetical protein JNK23_00395 [Opitutaceae bacterium]|nr:hypothetical protein [Opitutaceae bacterium]
MGVTFGTGAKFPAKFQHALFAADWTFGTLYAIQLPPDGASFRGERTEFVSGKSIPFTDVVINPKDGAMYFTVGGRRTQAALCRVTYTGRESTAPAKIAPPTEAAQLRPSLEVLHAEGTPVTAIDTAWPRLASPDRFVRFAARVAIERQPAEKWADRALAELQPQAAIEALNQEELQDLLACLLSGGNPADAMFRRQPRDSRPPAVRCRAAASDISPPAIPEGFARGGA